MASTFTTVACAVGIILHFVVAGTIVKHRNDREFRGPYFKLALSLIAADSMSCFIYLMKNAVLDIPLMPGLIYSNGSVVSVRWEAVVLNTLEQTTSNVNVWGITLIAINRCYFTTKPLTASAKWTTKLTQVLIAVQWTVSMIPPMLHQPSLEQSWDTTTNSTVLKPHLSKAILFGMFDSVKQLACSVIVFSLYVVIFVALWKHKKSKVDVASNKKNIRTEDKNREVRLAIQGAVIAAFLLPAAMQYTAIVILPPPHSGNKMDSAQLGSPDMKGGPPAILQDLQMINFYSTSMVLMIFGLQPLSPGGTIQVKTGAATSMHQPNTAMTTKF